jgi:hypothetical protein
MKTHLCFIFVLACVTSTRANFYIPKAKLSGETVYVRLVKDTAAVTAIFEFDEWETRDDKLIYFPMFATGSEDPVKVLARADFELEIGGKKIGIATPCAPPRKFRDIPSGPKILWFAANLDLLIGDTAVDINQRVIVRASYVQPLIQGVFYYLPVIAGQSDDLDREKRSWRYQMHARSTLRITTVLSKKSDFEQLGDSVVVFLKDGEIVEVR